MGSFTSVMTHSLSVNGQTPKENTGKSGILMMYWLSRRLPAISMPRAPWARASWQVISPQWPIRWSPPQS